MFVVVFLCYYYNWLLQLRLWVKSRLRQELSTTEVRPFSKAPNPRLLPGRRSDHCSRWVHLDGLNAENTFHCWLYSV